MESIWKKEIIKDETVVDIVYELIGSILTAAALYNFAASSEFLMTGFSGIALILYRLFKIPMGLSTIFLNVPVAILCWKVIGKRFLLKSLRCMIMSSIILDYVAPIFPTYEGDKMLAALATGMLGGLGYALIYTRNSSTGGSDFIVMAIKAKKPHLQLGSLIFVTDLVIILIGSFIFKDIDGVIYGLIINTCYAVVTNKLMYGLNAGKLAFIITEKGREMCIAIDLACGRGSTILTAKGGYQLDDKQVVMVACSNKEMFQVEKTAKEVDPSQFMIIMESNEVHGEGFHVRKVAQ
ncbi:MAG: YitT family protein [Lachnospiraceae bacterium]|nr:YitT family protein [Lachnospiraceae bacterium]